MERFVKGDVVVTLFPYSDLSQTKLRPALVVAVLPGENVIVCQITSQAIINRYVISITNTDFTIGSLSRDSKIRPEIIHTIERSVIGYKVGSLKPEKVEEVIKKLIEILEE
ncbi:growth inhibitor PemK [Oscillatoriales cyanobacterium USR001]|nr:growth inhibitor PemK [Oscillatoriales cyanobacterium USR001]